MALNVLRTAQSQTQRKRQELHVQDLEEKESVDCVRIRRGMSGIRALSQNSDNLKFGVPLETKETRTTKRSYKNTCCRNLRNRIKIKQKSEFAEI